MTDASQRTFDKGSDAASYDDYAGTYAAYIDRLSDPLARNICLLAQLTPGDRVLDVGTGSGIAARHAARIVGPTGSVLGVDLSEGMIASARRSVENWPGGVPEFRVMDAETIDLPDATFDAVTCLCAVRHFPDIARALGEMQRVLKPGGRIVVSFGHARPIAPIPLAIHVARRLSALVLNPVRARLIGPSYLTRLAYRLLPPPTQVVNTEWGESDPRGELVRRARIWVRASRYPLDRP